MAAELRVFQQRTVDAVSARFWGDDEQADRYLVADEVGLGKTLVAGGVIQRGLEIGAVKRVVYVCNNAALARQNVTRLTGGLEGIDIKEAGRLTELAIDLPRGSKPAVAAFTPGTSFRLGRRAGRSDERLLLVRLCDACGWGMDRKETAAAIVFSGQRAPGAFREDVRKSVESKYAFDDRLVERLRKSEDWKKLRRRFDRYATMFTRIDNRVDRDRKGEFYEFIGAVRETVAEAILRELKPDLVILDEFQRFRYLLPRTGGEDEEGGAEAQARRLAAHLLGRPSGRRRTKTLLLSATPFPPFTRAGEEEDHFAEFSKTMGYLLTDADYEELHRLLARFRAGLDEGHDEAASRTRELAETVLRRGMCRTERGRHTEDGRAMVKSRFQPLPFDAGLARDALEWVRLGRIAGARDPLALWKAIPYLAHFMDEYKIGSAVGAARKDRKLRDEVEATAKRTERLPSHAKLVRYAEIPDRHPGLRWLLDETVNVGLWELPWMPPTSPTWSLSGPWAKAEGIDKLLVFSGWRAVPKTLAALVSYTAEARAVHARLGREREEERAGVEDEGKDRTWWKRATTPVQVAMRLFRSRGGKVPNWAETTIWYPSIVLAEAAEVVTGEGMGSDRGPPLKRMKAAVAKLLEGLPSPSGTVDRSWYGIAGPLLDRHHGHACTPDFATGDNTAEDLLSRIDVDTLGKRPSDLTEVLALAALAGPAICARRSLAHVTGLPISTSELDDPATGIGWALGEYLHRRPHVIALKARHPRLPMWRAILECAKEGCLPALLDEQVHLVKDDCDRDGSPLEVEIAQSIREALGLHAASIRAHGAHDPSSNQEDDGHFGFRTHFCVRFGTGESLETGSNQSEVERTAHVRNAFNSPWWPFVLVTTSVGQEGLDFHRWCSSVVHWNLPWNPVDLEQREGRVHRYRGLAIRRNVVGAVAGDSRLGDKGGDPWAAIFAAAKQAYDGLSPDWIHPGPHSIRRIVPVLPMSRDRDLHDRLIHLLGHYRALLGQPRQEDLIDGANDRALEMLREQAFDLGPDGSP